MILVRKKVNMMMRKSLVIVIPFKESLVFILNAQISYSKPQKLKHICFVFNLNIGNDELQLIVMNDQYIQ